MKVPIESLLDREKIPVYSKFEESEANVLHNVKKEKLYDYYICDYCGNEILKTNKVEDRTGGVLIVPQSRTGSFKKLQVALCNGCLNKFLNELELYRINNKI